MLVLYGIIFQDAVQALGLSAYLVIFVGWPDVGRQQQAAGVDQQLAFAPVIFFVAVKPLSSTPCYCI